MYRIIQYFDRHILHNYTIVYNKMQMLKNSDLGYKKTHTHSMDILVKYIKITKQTSRMFVCFFYRSTDIKHSTHSTKHCSIAYLLFNLDTHPNI